MLQPSSESTLDGSDSGNIEIEQQGFMIEHFPRYDLVMLAGHEGEVDSIRQALSERGNLDKAFFPSGIKNNVWFDSAEDPKIVVKYRRHYSGQTDLDWLSHYQSRYTASQFLSVMAEIRNAQVIRSALSGEDAPVLQGLVHDLGFDSLEMIVPIGGVIDKRSAHKYTITPYIPNDGNLLEYNGSTRSLPEGVLKDFNQELFRLLTESKIELRDFGLAQILVQGKKLYLIDTEVSYRIQDLPE